jgi:hypothetical protein
MSSGRKSRPDVPTSKGGHLSCSVGLIMAERAFLFLRLIWTQPQAKADCRVEGESCATSNPVSSSIPTPSAPERKTEPSSDPEFGADQGSTSLPPRPEKHPSPPWNHRRGARASGVGAAAWRDHAGGQKAPVTCDEEALGRAQEETLLAGTESVPRQCRVGQPRCASVRVQYHCP